MDCKGTSSIAWKCMQYRWIFEHLAEGGVKKRFGQKNSHVRHGNFSSKVFYVWKKKSHIWTFQSDLVAIWKNLLFGYLKFEQIDELS